MVDFDELAEDAPEVDPTDPQALFKTLDPKQTHVELRQLQQKALALWTIQRAHRDVVLKLATGTGKTTLGLVMLLSHMREAGLPGMYLCPTNQLAEQVVNEGERCGVPCIRFGDGDRQPPPAVISGEAVLVTSVQKLFNSRTVFARDDVGFVPHALVVDDAHAAMAIVRKQFTVSATSGSPIYDKLLGLFSTELRSQSPGTTESLLAGDPDALLEVPYWAWLTHLDDVAKILAAESNSDPLKFVWGLIRNHLSGMRAVFSGRQADIVPEVLPVRQVAAYHGAAHRIFMSGTISDESELVRELDCAPEAAADPIEPSLGGVGERMMIVPLLMTGSGKGLSRDGLVTLCKKVSSSHAVVVLAPSDKAAALWSGAGARVVKGDTDDVGAAVDDLRAGKSRFVVFSNRYDGIDLPDDACRLLVVDGAPKAYSLVERVDGARGGPANARQRALMQRIEQGLGRAVRSPSDYAAVILWGDDLVAKVADRALISMMSRETRLQIELGLAIAREAKTELDPERSVESLIAKCLGRDTGWKKYYQKKVKVAPEAPDVKERSARIAYAHLERSSWELYVANRGEDSSRSIQNYINTNVPSDSIRAWLLQRAAWYSRSFNKEQSLIWQKTAHGYDPRMLRPPHGIQFPKQTARSISQASASLNWYKHFEHGHGAIAVANQLRIQLVFDPNASSELFEEALETLGEILGFDSCRPEKLYAISLDVLWLSGQHVMPLEAKNRVSSTEGISKHDAGQLTQAANWAKETYPERANHVPLIAHPSSAPGVSSYPPEGARAITPQLLGKLIGEVVTFVVALSARSAGVWTVEEVDRLMQTHALHVDGFLNTYTEKVS